MTPEDLHGLSLTDFLKSMIAAASKDPAAVSALLSAYEDAADDPAFRLRLRRLYAGAPLLDVGKHRYACAFYPASREQQNRMYLSERTLDRPLLGHLDTTPIADDELLGSPLYGELLRTIEHARTGVTPWDGSKFAMTNARVDGSIQLQCRPSRYFQALSTCDILKLEIQKAWFDKTLTTSGDWRRALPLRAAMHERGNPLVDACGRAACLAVSTLICYRSATGFRVLVIQRSLKKLALDKRRLHVIPAAMFEPHPSSRTVPYSVHHNVLRELLEECFDIAEPASARYREGWYEGHPIARHLQSQFDARKATLHLTGLACNLLNLRPEICTLLMLWDQEEAEAFVDAQKFNWEYEETEDAGWRGVRPLLKQPDHTLIAKHGLYPSAMVPPGAAALWAGIALARRLVKNPPQPVRPRRAPNRTTTRTAPHTLVSVYIRKHRGNVVQRPVDRGVAQRACGHGTFDITVFEPSRANFIRTRGGELCSPLSWPMRRLLWLMLKAVVDGRNAVAYADILSKGIASNPGAMAKLRTELHKRLNGVALLGHGSRDDRHYPVSPDVTFYWAVDGSDAAASVLNRAPSGVKGSRTA